MSTYTHIQLNSSCIFCRIFGRSNRIATVQLVEAAGVKLRGLGENTYHMPSATVKRLVDGWMNSLAHRENILNPEFTHLGFGEAGDYYTQVFARIDGATQHPTHRREHESASSRHHH